MRNKESWNYDFSSSQVGEDVLSGVHTSQRPLGVEGQKTSRKHTLSDLYGIEFHR